MLLPGIISVNYFPPLPDSVEFSTVLQRKVCSHPFSLFFNVLTQELTANLVEKIEKRETSGMVKIISLFWTEK
jgi:hypothetical protein